MKIKKIPEPILITETKKAPLIYSTKFNNYINNMLSICRLNKQDSPIANLLYSIEGTLCGFSYIDVTDKEDTVTLIPSPKIYQLYKKDFKEIYKSEFEHYTFAETDMCNIHNFIKGYKGVWNSNRVEIKIGKLAKKLNPKLSDIEIENFVNIYKAIYRNRNNPNFILVNGDEIKHWYNYENYKHSPDDKQGTGLGTLGKSCMRYDVNYFDIYTENTEICSMLILKSNDDSSKIIGRALIWVLSDGQIYMDRIYTHFDSDMLVFRNYAKQNGWLTHHDYFADYKRTPLKINLTKSSFRYYPYLDSFLYLNKKSKFLSTHIETREDAKETVVLIGTNGKTQKIV